jgi:hypothetical protein
MVFLLKLNYRGGGGGENSPHLNYNVGGWFTGQSCETQPNVCYKRGATYANIAGLCAC